MKTLSTMLLLLSLALLGGCLSPDDWHKVPVPKAVQEATGAPAEVTRSEYTTLWRPEYEKAIAAKAEQAKAERDAEAQALTLVNQQKQDRAEREVRTVRRSAAAQIAAISAQAESDAEMVADRLAGELAASKLAEGVIEKSYTASIERIRGEGAKTLARMDSDAAAAERKYQTTMSLMTLGTDAIGSATVGTPYGGLIAVALGTLGGIFIRKPGDKAKIDALGGVVKAIEAQPESQREALKNKIAEIVTNPAARVAIAEAKAA